MPMIQPCRKAISMKSSPDEGKTPSQIQIEAVFYERRQSILGQNEIWIP